jgi:hypothetical protein
MARETKPVSIRVPLGLPEKVRAITGLPFSTAVAQIMEAFVAAHDSPRKTLPSSNHEAHP